MILVKDKPGGEKSSIVILKRRGKPGSKYFDVWCSGGKRHYRKDGTCTHYDALLREAIPEKFHYRLRPLGWEGKQS